MLFCENLNSTKLRMKHLGGKWLYGLCWVGSQGYTCGITLVDGHPGTEESEELQVTIASCAAIANMGSGLIN